LLPKGMSVEQAQRLVIGLYQNTRLLKFLEKLSNKPENLLLQDGNKLCLIYGEARNYTYFQGPVSWAIYNGLYKLFLISHNIAYSFSQFHIFAYIFVYISGFMFLLHMINAFKTYLLSSILRNLPYIGAVIYYGGVGETPFSAETYYQPAGGSIWTNGLFGKGQWNGPFYGKLSSLPLNYWLTDFYPGVYGFTGLRLSSNSSDVYFGFAINVNVGPELP